MVDISVHLSKRAGALASATWLGGVSSHKLKGCVLIPSQGTCLDCGFRPPFPLHDMYQKPAIDVSLSHLCFSPSLPLSRKSVNMSSSEDKNVLGLYGTFHLSF